MKQNISYLVLTIVVFLFSEMARQIDKNHYLYLNVSGETKEIQMKGNSRSILLDKAYSGNFTIAPYEPEFVEIK